MEKVFGRPNALLDVSTSYCPGCPHGIIHRLIAEVLDEMELADKTVGVCPVGCSVTAYNYFNCDMIEAAHGRAPAVATGVKRALRGDVNVFVYQGDGDLAAIGTAETIHIASRGENITTIFVNNAIYGMTGGQMAPTTLPGMVTQTTPYGRDVHVNGYPVKVCELLKETSGAAYVVRVAVDTVPHVREAKKAIRKAFEVQQAGLGYAFVEVISACPTNWGLDPVAALKWAGENMIPYYPLGVYKDITAKGE